MERLRADTGVVRDLLDDIERAHRNICGIEFNEKIAVNDPGARPVMTFDTYNETVFFDRDLALEALARARAKVEAEMTLLKSRLQAARKAIGSGE